MRVLSLPRAQRVWNLHTTLNRSASRVRPYPLPLPPLSFPHSSATQQLCYSPGCFQQNNPNAQTPAVSKAETTAPAIVTITTAGQCSSLPTLPSLGGDAFLSLLAAKLNILKDRIENKPCEPDDPDYIDNNVSGRQRQRKGRGLGGKRRDLCVVVSGAQPPRGAVLTLWPLYRPPAQTAAAAAAAAAARLLALLLSCFFLLLQRQTLACGLVYLQPPAIAAVPGPALTAPRSARKPASPLKPSAAPLPHLLISPHKHPHNPEKQYFPPAPIDPTGQPREECSCQQLQSLLDNANLALVGATDSPYDEDNNKDTPPLEQACNCLELINNAQAVTVTGAGSVQGGGGSGRRLFSFLPSFAGRRLRQYLNDEGNATIGVDPSTIVPIAGATPVPLLTLQDYVQQCTSPQASFEAEPPLPNEIVPATQPPTPEDDFWECPYNRPCAPGNILTNDTTPNNAPLVPTLVTQPDNGTVALSPNGTFQYDPPAGFCGTVTWTYSVSDGVDPLQPTATVTLVVPCPSPPPPYNYEWTVPPGDETYTPPQGLLDNYTTPGCAYSVDPVLLQQPAEGNVTVEANGTYVFYPPSRTWSGEQRGAEGFLGGGLLGVGKREAAQQAAQRVVQQRSRRRHRAEGERAARGREGSSKAVQQRAAGAQELLDRQRGGAAERHLGWANGGAPDGSGRPAAVSCRRRRWRSSGGSSSTTTQQQQCRH